MKLFVLAGAVDLSHPLGCTPALWQLLKALHESDVEVLVAPYFGRPVESLWWRACENPRYRFGAAYHALTRFPRRSRGGLSAGSLVRKAELRLAQRFIGPRWREHLSSILEAEGDVSAVLIMTAPPNHLAGVGSAVRDRFGVPVCFYDTDLPTSLPAHGGFDSGHDRYRGADLSEYDFVLSNSQGALDEVRRMGARRAEVLWFGADPDLFRPITAAKDIDVFFYGYGVEQKRSQLRELVTIPSERLPHRRFVVAGFNLDMDFGRAERLGPISASELRRYVSRSRIHLNVPRTPHATVYASANTRIFELASMEEVIVTRSISGIEEWFRAGHELEVADTADHAVELYEALLEDPERRRSLGVAARLRVLKEHTYRHRAERLIELLRSVTEDR